jgi:hypothetical protein
MSSQQEQLSVFQVDDNRVVKAIAGVYTALADVNNGGENDALLTAMRDTLRNIGTQVAEAPPLYYEIDYWLNARQFARNNQYNEALAEYDKAIRANQNHSNPATYFERARILLRLPSPDYPQVLRDLDAVIASARKVSNAKLSGAGSDATEIFIATQLPATNGATDPMGTRDAIAILTPTAAAIISGTPGAPAIFATPETQLFSIPGAVALPPPPSAALRPFRSQFVSFVQIVSAVRRLIDSAPDMAISLADSNAPYGSLRGAELIRTLTPTPSFTNTVGSPSLVWTPTPSSVREPAGVDGISEQYFPETRHIVAGEFLNFFNQHGGLKIFGYPITGEFDWQGRRVQYFQKARLELHLDQPYPYRVQPGLLGEELGYKRPGVSAVANDQYRRFYPETGHILAYAFLNFFDANGGLDIFGYPISEFILENGRIVQYFQRAKMEWHPELSGDQQVQLGDLGLAYFQASSLDPRLRDPEMPIASSIVVPVSLRATASVKQPIIGRSGTQTVYVFVADQTNQPKEGADVTFVVRSLEGVKAFGMPPTDAHGVTAAAFDIGDLAPGQTVVIEVTVKYEKLSVTALTSFMPWY